MRETDFDEFSALLDGTCALLSRGAYVPDANSTAMFFRAVRAWSIEAVRQAFDQHIKDPQRGRFVPLPADIVAQLQAVVANDGRPGPEEAWATVLLGRDEASTIVWSAEMAEAYGIARPVLNHGDEVGARMAFKEAYQRLVATARAVGQPAKWTVSIGFDTAQRERVLNTALAAGLLSAPDVAGLLPPPEAPASGMATAVRERLLQLRESLVRSREVESADAMAKRETAAAKIAIKQRIAGYEGRKG
ncbi:hypothetical protein [Aquabacterium sp.]|uniref:hypothetical protein n=1 Tax=Aquabacterium sp. TaxID=1872578 RepID=UPI0037834FD1